MATDNDYTVDLTDSGVMPKDTPIDEDVEAGTILQQLTKELEKEIVRPEISSHSCCCCFFKEMGYIIIKFTRVRVYW